jgi:phosphoribosylglycinamide formyltransferase 2
MITQHFNEFEIHARAILGLPVDTTLRNPGASAVIYGQLDEKGIAFTGVADALSLPGVDIRLFGKPESFARRRMGVALARVETIDKISIARDIAKKAASLVKPIRVCDGLKIG